MAAHKVSDILSCSFQSPTCYFIYCYLEQIVPKNISTYLLALRVK